MGGTQLSKLNKDDKPEDIATGVRGVYYDSKKNFFRAQLIFQGKRHYLGSFTTLEDAAKARRRAEEDIFGTFLNSLEESE